MIPNLVLPTMLSQYQFGLLTLVDFSDQPTILVCLACRKAVLTDRAKQCVEHIREAHNNEIATSVPLTTFKTSNPLKDDDEEDPQPMEEEEELPDVLDPNDEHMDEEPKKVRKPRGYYTPLYNWFDTNHIKISKPSPCPNRIIPAIPFFPIVDGFRCSITDCLFTAHSSVTVQQHINNHMELDQDDAFPIPIACRMQTLDSKRGFTPHFAVLMPPQVPPVVSIQARALEQLRPHENPSTPLDKAPYTNAFLMRWRYRDIYPKEFSTYTTHVDKLLPRSTIIHTEHQSAKEQLLTLGCFAYAVRGSRALQKTLDVYRRLLGHKQPSSTLNTGEVTASFREHGSFRMTINYSILYATFLGYILRCVGDAELDPDLLLPDEIRVAAQNLQHRPDEVCNDRVEAALQRINIYPLDEAYLLADPFIKDTKYTGMVMSTAHSLFDDLHALGMSLVLHPRRLSPKTPELTVPMTRFFAWRAWSSYSRTFRSPNSLHGLFGQMQWMMRLVVFEQFACESKETPGNEWEILKRLHDEHLLQDAPTPFGILQDQIRYSCIVASTISGVPTTTWDVENNAVAVHGQSVSLDCFKQMVHGVIAKAKEILDQDILLGHRREICGLREGYIKRDGPIEDVAYSNTNGYSFLKANHCFSTCRDKLASHISNTPALLSRFHRNFVLDSEGFAWNHAEIKLWLEAVEVFLLYLSLCIYWASGQPCRLPELVSLVVENLPERQRNLFSVQGFLMIVQSYTKSLRMTQRPRPNIRMPAHEVEELIEAFLCYVHPLMGPFYTILGKSSFAQSHLLTQQGRPMRETEVSHVMRKISIQYTGFNWGVRIWRQYMISMSHMQMSPEILSLPVATTVITSQASHSQAAADASYDQREELSVSNISTQHFQQFRMASLAWLELIGLPHPQLSCTKELHFLTRQVQPMALNVPQTKDVEEATLALFRRLSQFERANISSIIKDSIVNTFADLHINKVVPTRTVPLQIEVRASTIMHLRRHLGPNASFRSLQQAQCIQHTLERNSLPLLTILPMGHGKSLIYQLPVLLEREYHLTTVVIVPLLSLAQAASNAAEKLGIRAHFINPKDLKPKDDLKTLNAELVIFTYDLLIASEPTRQWIQTKSNAGLIPRIVVDEAHTIITEKSFRTNFTHLPRFLKQLAVPLVLMTGTLPLAIEDELVTAFSNCGSIPSVRLPTDRPNLSYRVSSIPATEGTMEEIVELFREQVLPRLQANPRQRAIFYAQTTGQAQKLADMLEASLYMNPLELPTKQGYLSAWLDPDNGDINKHIMVATSSLSLGIDYDDCPDVWFFGDPYGHLVNFAQMAARGGRNGQVATIVLFPSEARYKHHKETIPDWDTFKKTTGCRRTPLSRHLDGSHITCASLPLAAFCDNCELESSIPPPTRERPLHFVPETARRAESILLSRMIQVSEALYSFVDSIRDSCVYCRVGLSPGPFTDHTAEKCPSKLAQKRAALKATLKDVRKKNRVENVVACLRCHLPQHKNIIGAMEHHLPYHGDSEHDCQLEWSTIDFLLGVLSVARLSKPILNRVGDPNHLFSWLLTPVTESPCDPLSEGHQLLRLHFLIPAIAFISPFSPLRVTGLCGEDWFGDWLLQPEEHASSPPLLSTVTLKEPSRLDESAARQEGPSSGIRSQAQTQAEWEQEQERLTRAQVQSPGVEMERDPPAETPTPRQNVSQADWDAEQERFLQEMWHMHQ